VTTGWRWGRWAVPVSVVVAGLAMVWMATPSGAATVSIGPPCSFVFLPRVDGGDNILTATDRTGRYQVGIRAYYDADRRRHEHLIVWRDGVPQLGPELDTIRAEFSAVSSTGVAVGFRSIGDHQQAIAFVYGQIVALPSPSGDVDTEAVGVNARGEIVGVVVDAGRTPMRVVVWSPDGGVRQLTTPPGFDHAQAVGIDEDGTVFGTVTNDPIMQPDVRLVIWQPGVAPRVLTGSRTDTDDVQFGAIGIRDGKVTGSQRSWTSSGESSETLEWNVSGGDPRVLVPADPGASIFAVNSSGSMLTVGGLSHGVALLKGDVIRPAHLEGNIGVSPGWLSDNDLVFGSFTQGGWPAYADCRT
jgi:uncharacterized membrane protein